MPGRMASSLIATVALAMLCSLPSVATAHGGLEYANPGANAALLEAPQELELLFSEAIDPSLSNVSLFDEAGASVGGLGRMKLDATGLDIKVSLPALSPGLYTVAYRTTSAVDGHVVEGSYVFLYDPSGTRPAPNVPSASSSPSSSPLLVGTRWVALASALLALGTAAFWLISARPAVGTSTTESDAIAPWGLLALSAWLAFGGLASYLTVSAQLLGLGAGHPGHGSGTVPLDFAAPFGSTPFAMAMRLALGGAGLAALLASVRWVQVDEGRRRASPPRGSETPMLVAVLGTAAASLAGSALAGHASSLGGLGFATIDWLHLVSVAIWLGALPGLLVLVRRGRRTGARTARGALQRHSRVALVAAPVVALTGLANSPLVLGAPRELAASDYGNLLLAKALLFSIALALGSANFFLVRVGSLRRALPIMAAELGIGALAVVVAATLTTAQPSSGRLPVLSTTPAGIVQLIATDAGTKVHLAVNRPEPGPQRYQVSVARAADDVFRTDVTAVDLVFTPPASSTVAMRRVSLAPGADPWLWGTGGDYTPVVGDWSVEVDVRATGAPTASVTFSVSVIPATKPELLPPPPNGIGIPVAARWVWGVIPQGTAGWATLALLTAVLACLGLLAWLRRYPGVGLARVVLAVLVLIIGLGVVSRETVRLADAAPAAAAAMPNPHPPDAASLGRGQTLYTANCTSCHGPAGEGNGAAAAGLLPAPGNLPHAIQGESDGAIEYRITNGSLGGAMPAFALTLTEAERWDLVNYLRHGLTGAP